MSVMYVGEGLVIEGSDLDNVAHIDDSQTAIFGSCLLASKWS